MSLYVPLHYRFMFRMVVFLYGLFPLALQAQWTIPCIDTNRINPFYQCNDPTFDPVCGCDNVTYRNGCVMTNVAGINYPSTFENGVCKNDFFYFHFYPNPVVDRINFNMQFAAQEVSPATMKIYTIDGDLVFMRLLTNFSDFATTPLTITFTDLETGLYILVIQSRDVFKISKFIKQTF